MFFMVLFIGAVAFTVSGVYMTCESSHGHEKIAFAVFVIGVAVAIIGAVCAGAFCSKVPYKNVAEFEEKKQNVQIMVDGIDFDTCSDEVLSKIAEDVVEINSNAEWYENHRNGSFALYLTKTPKDTSPIKIENERLKEAVQKIKDTN